MFVSSTLPEQIQHDRFPNQTQCSKDEEIHLPISRDYLEWLLQIHYSIQYVHHYLPKTCNK